MEIPKITDERLNELYARIKPVVRYAEVSYGGKKHYEEHEKGDLYYIKDVDLRGTAFTWDPKPTKKAVGLTDLDTITTYHTYGYHGFFKPSISEVLAQIPENYMNETAAFETHYESLDGNYHSAITQLYRKKSLSEIKNDIALLEKERNTLEGKL